MAEYDFNTANLLNFGSKPNQAFNMNPDLLSFNQGNFTTPADQFSTNNVMKNWDMSNMGNTVSTANPGWMDKMLGWKGGDGTQHGGWGMPALGAANSMFQSWIGLNQLNLAKKAFGEQKRQFNMNWDAQRSNVNRELEDRQNRRIAFGDSTAEDTASYMSKWRIK